MKISKIDVVRSSGSSGTQLFNLSVDDTHNYPLSCGIQTRNCDGDTMAFYLAMSNESYSECCNVLGVEQNQRNPGNGAPAFAPSHEVVVGLFHMSTVVGEPIKHFKNLQELENLRDCGHIKTNEAVYFHKNGERTTTCLGRLQIENVLGVPVKKPLTKGEIKKLVEKSLDAFGPEEGLDRLKAIQDLGLDHVTKAGISFCLDDVAPPSEHEFLIKEGLDREAHIRELFESGKITEAVRKERTIRMWDKKLTKLFSCYEQETDWDNNVYMMYTTGARVSKSQMQQLVSAKGLTTNTKNEIIERPILNSLRVGLEVREMFSSCSGSRKSLADKTFITPKSGFFARKLVSVARDLYVVDWDCGATNGISIPTAKANGRYTVENKLVGKDIHPTESRVTIRSPITCQSPKGVCQHCYGIFPADKKLPDIGTAAGVIAGQSLSEQSTQLSLRSFHTSGAAEVSDSIFVVRAKHDGQILITDKHVQVGNSRHPYHADAVVTTAKQVKKGDAIITYDSGSFENSDIAATLPKLEGYFELHCPKGELAEISKNSGRVHTAHEEDGSISIYVSEKLQAKVVDKPILVTEDQEIEAGHKLTFGEIDVKKLYATTNDVKKSAEVFLQQTQTLYESNGVYINSVHYEMIFRGMLEITDNGLLRFDGGESKLLGVTAASKLNPSWLRALGFGWIESVVVRAVTTGAQTYDLPSERIMYGKRIK